MWPTNNDWSHYFSCRALRELCSSSWGTGRVSRVTLTLVITCDFWQGIFVSISCKTIHAADHWQELFEFVSPCELLDIFLFKDRVWICFCILYCLRNLLHVIVLVKYQRQNRVAPFLTVSCNHGITHVNMRDSFCWYEFSSLPRP